MTEWKKEEKKRGRKEGLLVVGALVTEPDFQEFHLFRLVFSSAKQAEAQTCSPRPKGLDRATSNAVGKETARRDSTRARKVKEGGFEKGKHKSDRALTSQPDS